MNPKENRESRDACVRPSLKLKSDHRAFLRRLTSLAIIEARSNLKLGAIFLPDQDSAAHISTAASTTLVPDHCGFRIFESFNFQQTVASSMLIGRFRVLNHDTFTLSATDLVHPFFQVFLAFACDLVNQLNHSVGCTDVCLQLL